MNEWNKRGKLRKHQFPENNLFERMTKFMKSHRYCAISFIHSFYFSSSFSLSLNIAFPFADSLAFTLLLTGFFHVRVSVCVWKGSQQNVLSADFLHLPKSLLNSTSYFCCCCCTVHWKHFCLRVSVSVSVCTFYNFFFVQKICS